jgi:cytochrome c oxidase assembly protein subunit 15
LGDTLFPAASVASGMRQEFAATAGTLLRLRVLHPALAVAASLVLLAAARAAGRNGRLLAVLVCLQLAAGALNLLLLAPVWMQIVHLLIADLLWVVLVVLALELGRRRALGWRG